MNQPAVPHRLPLPTGLPVGAVNVYLFPEPEPVLVDTGVRSEESLSALQTGLAEHGLSFADLRRIIISHPHIDHFGLTGTIAARSRATIHILAMSIPWLTDYRTLWRRRVAYYRDRLFPRLGLPDDITAPILTYYTEIESRCDSVPPERIVPFQAEDRLSMGGAAWRVLHTPGHTNTLTCFYQPETRQFLSTDMLLPIAPTPIPD
ncbi:MAG: MBL fold metallo-hydrolase, partial [Caldilineae bacterium]